MRIAVAILLGIPSYPLIVFASSIFGISFIVGICSMLIYFPKLFGNNRKEYIDLLLFTIYPFVYPIVVWKSYCITGDFEFI